MFQSKLKSICTTAAIALTTAVGISSVQAADYPATRSQPGTSADQSAQPAVSDSSIRTRVEKALHENNVSGISVKSDMGVVSLVGTIPSEDARISVARIVASVEGVQGVETTGLRVKAAS